MACCKALCSCDSTHIMFLDIIQRPVFISNRTMDNVQKHNICTDVLSSQTFDLI
jgi:hypothetical protein